MSAKWLKKGPVILSALVVIGGTASLLRWYAPNERHTKPVQTDEIAQLRRSINDLEGRVEAARVVANSAAVASLSEISNQRY